MWSGRQPAPLLCCQLNEKLLVRHFNPEREGKRGRELRRGEEGEGKREGGSRVWGTCGKEGGSVCGIHTGHTVGALQSTGWGPAMPHAPPAHGTYQENKDDGPLVDEVHQVTRLLPEPAPVRGGCQIPQPNSLFPCRQD